MRKLDIVASLLLCQAAHSLAIGRDARDLLRGDSPPALPVPSRPLPWNEVNFISTSDTHGWLRGHQHDTWPEPNYSGDFGTFASFVHHMRNKADELGVDLLVVDAGDHHDGSGLVSSSPESAGKADDIFSQLQYDVLAIGNHELYKYESAKWIYDRRAQWEGRFLTSNVNITVEEDGEVISTPIGSLFAKFQTPMYNQVTAFGVIFDFKAHDKNLTIQAPTEMAKEKWFLEAIEERPDYFVLVGHMPGRGETAEWKPIYDAIRAVHPLVPVFIFGGHTHVRDCVQYDDRSIAIVPGRYLETIAFTSSSMPFPGDKGAPLTMNRRYIDANPVSYRWHTGKTAKTFDTHGGLQISKGLEDLAQELNLSTTFGTAPHNYYLNRHPYGHPRSVVTLFQDHVLPATVQDKNRDGPRIIIGNSGSLRFDLFRGPFDRNDELTVSPFTSKFLYTRLPAGVAGNITHEMNRAGASRFGPLTPQEDDDAYVRKVYNEWLQQQWDDYLLDELMGETDEVVLDGPDKKPHTLGFVTKDACPGRGDDIRHIPVPYSPFQMDFVQSPMPHVKSDEVIDVVVMDFAMPDFLTAANVVAPEMKVKWEDFKPYAEGLEVNTVFGDYARLKWQ